jgi:hypothetical protein
MNHSPVTVFLSVFNPSQRTSIANLTEMKWSRYDAFFKLLCIRRPMELQMNLSDLELTEGSTIGPDG